MMSVATQASMDVDPLQHALDTAASPSVPGPLPSIGLAEMFIRRVQKLHQRGKEALAEYRRHHQEQTDALGQFFARTDREWVAEPVRDPRGATDDDRQAVDWRPKPRRSVNAAKPISNMLGTITYHFCRSSSARIGSSGWMRWPFRALSQRVRTRRWSRRWPFSCAMARRGGRGCDR